MTEDKKVISGNLQGICLDGKYFHICPDENAIQKDIEDEQKNRTIESLEKRIAELIIERDMYDSQRRSAQRIFEKKRLECLELKEDLKKVEGRLKFDEKEIIAYQRAEKEWMVKEERWKKANAKLKNSVDYHIDMCELKDGKIRELEKQNLEYRKANDRMLYRLAQEEPEKIEARENLTCMDCQFWELDLKKSNSQFHWGDCIHPQFVKTRRREDFKQIACDRLKANIRQILCSHCLANPGHVSDMFGQTIPCLCRS